MLVHFTDKESGVSDLKTCSVTHLGSGGTRNLASRPIPFSLHHTPWLTAKSLHPGSLGVGVHHPHNWPCFFDSEEPYPQLARNCNYIHTTQRWNSAEVFGNKH